MAREVTRAMLTIEFHDGTTKKWRFELASDAPYAVEELKDSLVREFVGDGKQTDDFEITASGTFAAPEFLLKETHDMFFNREELAL
jgi:hypothetical protein